MGYIAISFYSRHHVMLLTFCEAEWPLFRALTLYVGEAGTGAEKEFLYDFHMGSRAFH